MVEVAAQVCCKESRWARMVGGYVWDRKGWKLNTNLTLTTFQASATKQRLLVVEKVQIQRLLPRAVVLSDCIVTHHLSPARSSPLLYIYPSVSLSGIAPSFLLRSLARPNKQTYINTHANIRTHTDIRNKQGRTKNPTNSNYAHVYSRHRWHFL